jgi:spermidine/putrescine-binding protein
LALNHPVDSENLEHLEAAADLMGTYVEAQRPLVGGIYDVLDALDSGDLDAVLTYSGDAALYAEDNDKIAYFIPDEGAPLWLDNFALAADSRAEAGAYAFFNFLLRPEIAAENAQSLWYATPNKAAMKYLDPEFLADEGLWPNATVRDLLVFTSKASHERDVILSRGMQKVMELIREQQNPSRVVTGPVVDEVETFDPLPENYPSPEDRP